MSCQGISVEQCGALRDAQTVCRRYGDLITVYDRTEANITRDSYNSIKARSTTSPIPKTMYAYPIDFQPNQKQIEKAGLRESCELMIYTPKKSWSDIGVDFEDIDLIRDTFIIRNIKYVIKEKGLSSQFGNTYLYCTFGLSRL